MTIVIIIRAKTIILTQVLVHFQSFTYRILKIQIFIYP